jgi:hypothetical protein
MKRWPALLLYLALSVPFGIAVHLGAEFASLGRDADDLAFSPLHAYLAVLAVAALVTFFIAGGFFASASERRRRIGLMSSALPFGGRGPGFFFFSAGLQFAFFALSQLGEGCPFCKGDILVGIAAAIVASFAGSFALMRLRRHIVRAIAAIHVFLSRNGAPRAADRLPRYATCAVRSVYATFAAVFGNRPPPITLPA